VTKQRDQYCTMGICHEHDLPYYHLDSIHRDKEMVCQFVGNQKDRQNNGQKNKDKRAFKYIDQLDNNSLRVLGFDTKRFIMVYYCTSMYLNRQFSCTFPTLILKLYVVLELFPFKADKRVLFHAKFTL
jgi:hypothetical protein